MILVGEYALTIYGDDIDFVEVEDLLGIHASKIVEKGKIIVANKIAPTSIWTYTKKVSEETLFENGLKLFLNEINDKKEEIVALSLQYSVEINCYLRSEYGQFGFGLNKDIYAILDEIKIPINFHILSFGKVEE